MRKKGQRVDVFEFFHRALRGDYESGVRRNTEEVEEEEASEQESEEELDSVPSEEEEDGARVVLPSCPQLHQVSLSAGTPSVQGGKFHQAARIPDRYQDIERFLWQMQCHQAAEFKHQVALTLGELHHGMYKTAPGEEHAWVQCKVIEADDDFSACVELNENDERVWKRLRKDNVDMDNVVPEKRHSMSSWWEGWILEVEGHKEVVYADEGKIGVTELSDTAELFTGTLHLVFGNGRPQRLKAPRSLRIRPVEFIRPAINHYKNTVKLHREVSQGTVCRPVKDLLCQIANPNTGPGRKAQDGGLRDFACMHAAPGSFNGIIASLPGGLSAMQGPPGTGKSTAVKTIITERVPEGAKGLVVCVKNKAVDALVEKLKDLPGGVVVFGNKRSLGSEAVKHRYDLKAEQHPEWVNWVWVLRQLQELFESLKKGSEDAQDLHHCSVPHSSKKNGPSRVPEGASEASAGPENGRSKASASLDKKRSEARDVPSNVFFDEEENFMAGCADSDNEAEPAGMAVPEERANEEHSGESPDMLTGQDRNRSPFGLCLEDDPAVSISDIKDELMLKAPSIQCGSKHVWEQSWRSPVEVLLSLRDALLLLFGKLGEPNSRDKRKAEGKLKRVLDELRDLASSPQKLRTAAEQQQFELDSLNHFMEWMTHDAVGDSMLTKVGGHAMRDVLSGASAIMCTIDTVPTLFGVLEKCKSSVGGCIKTVMIDEAGCVPEYELPILLAFSPVINFILIGDHHQLPCFSRITERSQEKLGIKNHSRSLLERMVKCEAYVPMLRVQYRMAKQICDVVSSEFYGGKLLTGTVAPQSRLQPLRWVEAPMDQSQRVPKDLMARQRYESNPAEAQLAMKYALEAHDRLLDQGISYPNIYIIAPYNRQVDILEDLLEERRSKRAIKLGNELARYGIVSRDLESKNVVQHLLTRRHMSVDCMDRLQALKYQLELKGIQVLTVDKAQGSEADVVVLSTVKCGSFTQDPRRMCVALSRARLQSILVGNSGEMQQHPMWASIINAYKQGA